MGMTYEQFWKEDSTLIVAYRKAYKLKTEAKNHEMWLQGLYFYDALCCAAPILRAFSTARKPISYPSEPYELAPATRKEKEDREYKHYESMKAKTQAFVESFNNNFRKKEGGC